MPSPVNDSPARSRSFWPAIVRTLLVEILVLLALSGAIVGYLKWSSDAAWDEFIAASKQSAAGPTTPMQTAKSRTACERRA